MFTMGAKLEGESFETKKLKQKDYTFEIIPKKEHNLVFTFEKRRGKPVTLVGRFFINEKEKKSVLKLLKTKLACGGSIKGEWLELQGDVKDKIKTILEHDSWKFR
jgi:translation initiation factor 1